uniref:Ig-like domain-containing protein n=1 Tax=Sinocyclocheilus rhinocerous TaxID=307959 RepID=A0A673HYR4_9TELE
MKHTITRSFTLHFCFSSRSVKKSLNGIYSLFFEVLIVMLGKLRDEPKPVVKMTPDQRVFRGETVTLTCDIQRGGNIQWTYSWFKDGDPHDTYRTTAAEFRFRAYYVSYSGKYSCRGERSDSQRSDISAAVTLTVSGECSNLHLPVFTEETVNLKCEIESCSNWRYEWYKDGTKVSEDYTVNGNTLTIERSETSDSGQYTCKGHIDRRSVSSQSSSAVSLSVKGELSVFTVNLKCRNVLTNDRRPDWTAEWRYEWYKGTDSVKLQTSDHYSVDGNTLSIVKAITSDQGQYWCRGQRDKRPKSSQSSSAVSITMKGKLNIIVLNSFYNDHYLIKRL